MIGSGHATGTPEFRAFRARLRRFYLIAQMAGAGPISLLLQIPRDDTSRPAGRPTAAARRHRPGRTR